MNQKVKGIVLKSFTPTRNTVVLFEREQGKRYGIVFQNKHIPHGAILGYVSQVRFDRNFLQQMEILKLPECYARLSLVFLHHILELCDFFIPIGYNEEALFDFLFELCAHGELLVSGAASKHLLLFKVCVLLGIYPEDSYFHTQFFHKLARLSIHEMLKCERVDTEMINKLDNWIRECVALHPFVDRFKTMRFLTYGRNQ